MMPNPDSTFPEEERTDVLDPTIQARREAVNLVTPAPGTQPGGVTPYLQIYTKAEHEANSAC